MNRGSIKLIVTIYLWVLCTTYCFASPQNEVIIKPKVSISSTSDFILTENKFVFFDAQEQQLSFINKTLDTVLFSLKINAEMEHAVYLHQYKDSNVANLKLLEFKSIAAKIGFRMGVLVMESYTVVDENVYLIVKGNYFDFRGSDTFQTGFYQMLKIDATEQITYFPFQKEEAMSVNPALIWPGAQKNEFYIAAMQKSNPAYVYGIYKIINGNCVLKDFAKDTIPSDYNFHIDPYMLTYNSLAYPYIGYSFFGGIYKDNKKVDITFFEKPDITRLGFNPFSNPYTLMQVYLYKNILYIIHTDKDTCYFVNYDTLKKETIQEEQVSVTPYIKIKYTNGYLVSVKKDLTFNITKIL